MNLLRLAPITCVLLVGIGALLVNCAPPPPPELPTPPAEVTVPEPAAAPSAPVIEKPVTTGAVDIMEKVCAMDSSKANWTPSSDLVLNRKTALWWLNWYRESKDVKGVILDAGLNAEAERIADQIRQCPRAALDSPFSGKVIVRVGDRSLNGFVRAAIGDPKAEAIILRKDVRRVGAALLVDKDSHWISHWVIIFR
jgi:hypothetical protein